MSYKNNRILSSTKNPKYWGPSFWDMMFISANTLPGDNGDINVKETDKNRSIKNFITLIRSISRVIPCLNCKHHFKMYMKENSINDIKCREDAITWIYNAKTDVNKRRKKSSPPISIIMKRYKP